MTFDVAHVERFDDALSHLVEDRPDAVILDLNLPDSQGLDTFHRLREANPDVPVVVLTVIADEDTAVEALRLGAQDYLFKTELTGRAMPRIVRYAIERQELRSQLAGVSRELQRLIAHAAHDLRSPVAIVAGVSDMLAEGPEELPDEELDDLVSMLRRQSRRLGDLIGDLMDVARANREIDLTPVAVDDAIRDAIGALPPPSHIQVDPPEDVEVSVAATPSGLQRIITNLLSNAYAYARSQVRVTVTGDDDGLRIAVADDGDGVPDGFIDGLFDDFSRGPNARSREGTGLGLAIVRRLAANFSGSVRYTTSNELGGARFEVTLPPRDGHAATTERQDHPAGR